MIWPSKKQWGQFFRILSRKEKIIFLFFLLAFTTSSASLLTGFYLKNTEIKPKEGGVFREGVLGRPTFINPIYATDNDTNRDLVELIFSGLMKYDNNKEIIPDLAKEIKVSDDGKNYDVSLKNKLLWSDGSPLTTDDVIFTIKTIQNPDVKSPLRASWLGVEVEKISDQEMLFKLKNPYNSFPESLTLKILPKHVWQDVSSQNFLLSDLNFKPVGSGPYKLTTLEKDSSNNIKYLTLKVNANYYNNQPFIKEIQFRIFEKESDLIEAGNFIQLFSLAFITELKIKKLWCWIPKGKNNEHPG